MFFNLNLNVDKIIILGLLRNKNKIEKKFSKIFSQNQDMKKLEYHLVEGIGSTQNDGNYNSSLWSILNHSTLDNISKDIFTNHVNIYKYALKNNMERILVLEDDAYFENINRNQEKYINNFLSKNKSYDILYLGYCNWPWMWSTWKNLHIVKPFSPLALHSYIINKKGMEKVIHAIHHNPKLVDLHIDKVLAQNNILNKYAVYPMIGFQEKDPSLYEKAFDKIGFFYIPFKTFCKINEQVSLFIPLFLVFILCLYIYYKFY
jgi:hypothetical protein